MRSPDIPVLRHTRRSTRVCLCGAVIAALLLPACLPQDRVDLVVEKVELNELPTEDRGGSMNRLGNARFGAYFDGVPNTAGAPLETTAILYPELERTGYEALLKSDCYWSSSQESFTVSWETVLTVCRASAR
jgi:hypothetical protein